FDLEGWDGLGEFFVEGGEGKLCWVEVWGFGGLGVERFGGEGVVDDGELGGGVFEEGEGKGEMGEWVEEVVGWVYGVEEG
ncbi:hypothetical protein, partial [Neisseria sicca]|uniref:hypothetical protein n=1 Tax=Neisseria sicca TaxID=490 RepID=UPI001C9A1163